MTDYRSSKGCIYGSKRPHNDGKTVACMLIPTSRKPLSSYRDVGSGAKLSPIGWLTYRVSAMGRISKNMHLSSIRLRNSNSL